MLNPAILDERLMPFLDSTVVCASNSANGVIEVILGELKSITLILEVLNYLRTDPIQPTCQNRVSV